MCYYQQLSDGHVRFEMPVTHPKANYDPTVFSPILRRMRQAAFVQSGKENVKSKEVGGQAEITDGLIVLRLGEISWV